MAGEYAGSLVLQWSVKEPVLLEEIPVSATDVMQIALVEISGRVPAVAIAVLKDGTGTKLLFYQLAFNENYRILLCVLNDEINRSWLTAIFVENVSILIFEH